MNGEQQQCVFCHIASGKIPAKKVYEDAKVTAVLDINPASPGHILVIPKEHVAVMPQMSDELVGHLGMISKQLSHALIRALKAEGTSVFVANGVAAGQRAPHFLLHIIPRSPDDGVALQPSPGKFDEKMLGEVSAKLAAAVGKQFGVEVNLPKTKEKPVEKEEKPVEKPEPVEEPDKKLDLDEIAEFLSK
ncbi:HIT domain-containing protein [Candidatus Woesearchaeota archaeon]|nr:HIT domain-containing protein [Candidatus Woesearchaeota archaeon]MBW3016463.1 HIT domain-containing protein [Candidatus Woesearchaeota archaeon]